MGRAELDEVLAAQADVVDRVKVDHEVERFTTTARDAAGGEHVVRAEKVTRTGQIGDPVWQLSVQLSDDDERRWRVHDVVEHVQLAAGEVAELVARWHELEVEASQARDDVLATIARQGDE